MKVILSCQKVYPIHQGALAGIDKYPYFFAKHLIQKGVEVSIFTSLDTGKPRRLMRDGIQYTLIPPKLGETKWAYPLTFLFSFNLARYLSKEQFDILHSYEDTAFFYLHLSRRKRKPVILLPIFIRPTVVPARAMPMALNSTGMARIIGMAPAMNP